MKILYKIVSKVYQALAYMVGKSPIFYLAEQSLKDGVTQEKHNKILDLLEIS